MQQNERKEILFIVDEVQKVPNWSETVKKEWDLDYRKKTNTSCSNTGKKHQFTNKKQ